MLTEEQERACTEASPVGRRKSRGSILSFGFSAIALGLLLGTGPISIFPALLGVIGGLISLYRLRTAHDGRGGSGMATAAVVIGLFAGATSLIMIFSTHAA